MQQKKYKKRFDLRYTRRFWKKLDVFRIWIFSILNEEVVLKMMMEEESKIFCLSTFDIFIRTKSHWDLFCFHAILSFWMHINFRKICIFNGLKENFSFCKLVNDSFAILITVKAWNYSVGNIMQKEKILIIFFSSKSDS